MNHARHPFGPRAVSARSGKSRKCAARADTGHKAIRMAFSSARAQGRCALITYLTLGYPSRAGSLELIPALQAGGADIIELGVPFSDPVADGPTIQRASQAAIEAGMTPSGCLELAAQLRKNGVTLPLVLMGYYNPIFSYGLEAYARDAAGAGVDGLIVPDLPPEEAEPLQSACRNEGLALIFLVAPTSDKARIAALPRSLRPPMDFFTSSHGWAPLVRVRSSITICLHNWSTCGNTPRRPSPWGLASLVPTRCRRWPLR